MDIYYPPFILAIVVVIIVNIVGFKLIKKYFVEIFILAILMFVLCYNIITN